MKIDGVSIPHAYPGTKLKLQNAGQPGGIGTNFEASLLRNIAAGLGLSYEEFSRDFTQTNYSSARAAMGQTWKMMQARKKSAADAFATDMYRLWFEEAYNRGEFAQFLPENAPSFYDGMNKDFYTNCTWIGASRGQIDELKETQAALKRIEGGLSTYEVECARFGDDFREVFRQRQREKAMMDEMGLSFNTSGESAKNESKPGDKGDDTEKKNDSED
jgi:lambda family phage portal protein